MDYRSKDVREAVRRAVGLFNSRKFFRFHEVLEKVWLDYAGRDRDFLQGLIQVGAAFVHYYRGRNHRGALILLRKGSRALKNYPPDYWGLDVKKLLRDVESVVATLERQGGFPENFRFPKLGFAGKRKP